MILPLGSRKRLEQRSHLVNRAAAVGALAPEAWLRFGRPQIDQIQLPPIRDVVAIRVRLGKVMNRVEEEHGNIRG